MRIEQNDLKKRIAELKNKNRTDLLARFDSCPYGFWEYLKYRDSKFYHENRKNMKLYAVILMLVELSYVYNFAVSMPRRDGKSYTLSRFTAFSIGRNPTRSNTRNSFAKSKSEDFSKDIRKFITDKNYQNLFPKVKLDNKAIEKWAITLAKQHTFLAGGIDGGTTGSGTDNLLMGDDLIKSMEQATSPAYRSSLRKFILGVYESGKEEGCKRIECATRWINDDPIGESISIAKNMGQKVLYFDAFEKRITDKSIEAFANKIIDAELSIDDWVQIKIPALNKWDESTDETHRSTKKLLKIRQKHELRHEIWFWECIYQQNPVPKEGLLFPADELNYFYYEDIDETLSEVLFIDPAGKGSNNTCGAFGKVESKDKIFITDIIYTPEKPEISKPICVKKIIEHQNDLKKISGEGNNLGDIYLKNVEQMLTNSDILLKIRIKTTSENKESKIFIYSDDIKRTFWYPAEFDRYGNRQYEIDSPMDEALNSLTRYLGKIDGAFVTNQEDDLLDALVGILRMFNEAQSGFRVGFY